MRLEEPSAGVAETPPGSVFAVKVSRQRKHAGWLRERDVLDDQDRWDSDAPGWCARSPRLVGQSTWSLSSHPPRALTCSSSIATPRSTTPRSTSCGSSRGRAAAPHRSGDRRMHRADSDRRTRERLQDDDSRRCLRNHRPRARSDRPPLCRTGGRSPASAAGRCVTATGRTFRLWACRMIFIR